jgi:hypothetical protein
VKHLVDLAVLLGGLALWTWFFKVIGEGIG